MIREFLADTPLAVFPLIAFILFAVTFLAVLAALVVGAAKHKNFDEVAALPLESETPVRPGGNIR